MSSSLHFDDDGVIHITTQTGPFSHKTQSFRPSELSHLVYDRPTILGNGTLQFFLNDGTSTAVLQVHKKHKRLFDQLVEALNKDLAESKSRESSRKAEPRRRPVRAAAPVFKSRNSSEFLANNEFVSIDIEWTDSSNPYSLCEIGIAKFSDGTMTDTYRQYVRPQGKYEMGWREKETHGISEELIDEASHLVELWPAIQEFIGGRAWVLHNATQDVKRILAALGEDHSIEVTDFHYLDTMLISKKTPWITSSNGLSEVAAFLGVKRDWALFDNRESVGPEPHGALEDAIATGEVLIKMMGMVGYSSILPFTQMIGTTPGFVSDQKVQYGPSAAGESAFQSLDQVPPENELLAKHDKAEQSRKKVQDKREQAESIKAEFLKDPQWSTIRVTSGMTVCFTQLLPWDENGRNHEQAVLDKAEELGLNVLGGIRSDVDLLVINDHAVEESAKLRDALSRKKPIPVTTYSIFRANNPEFPEWLYKNAWQYQELVKEGFWK